MARVEKICRVCGKKYIACGTPNTTNAFRWRDVACSLECGREYLRRVCDSRSKPNAETGGGESSAKAGEESAPVPENESAGIKPPGESFEQNYEETQNHIRRIKKK